MFHHEWRLPVSRIAALCTALCASAWLAGCGGGSASTTTAPPAGNAPVTGVSMPSSISVVTATNAG